MPVKGRETDPLRYESPEVLYYIPRHRSLASYIHYDWGINDITREYELFTISQSSCHPCAPVPLHREVLLPDAGQRDGVRAPEPARGGVEIPSVHVAHEGVRGEVCVCMDRGRITCGA